jgi:ARG and Rhodanese-Phosphatase-superfamily-associated Protein domain
MTRRGFIQVLGVGAGVAVATSARADRIRVLPEVGAGEPTVVGDRVGPDLQRFLDGVRVGERRAHRGLTVFWLHAPRGGAAFAIRTLDEARARGELSVTELDQAAVSGLVIDNRGPVHVLLLAGEILLGGKQHRIVVEDVLVPPRSGPLTLPVYCVEQGRWTGETKHFTTRGAFAAPQLRSKVLERSGQREVWAEVDRYAARAAAPSSTGSYQAIHDKPEVQAHQKEVEDALDLRTVAGAEGAAVFAAETLVGLDLFQDPSLFAREWPKLLRAHALETYGRSVHDKADERRLRVMLDDFLRAAVGAAGRVRRGLGVGRLVEFRVDRRRGSALVAEGQVVHVAIL